jgi:hypothetical protein
MVKEGWEGGKREITSPILAWGTEEGELLPGMVAFQIKPRLF